MRRNRWVLATMVSALAGYLPVTVPTSMGTATAHAGGGGTDATARPAAVGRADDGGVAPTATATPTLDDALRQRIEEAGSGTITVEVVGDVATVAAVTGTLGGTVVRAIDDLTLVHLPATRVRQLAAAAGVRQVRTPVDVRQSAAHTARRLDRGTYLSAYTPITGEWNNAGYAGGKAKIGIIGLFDTTVLDQEIAANELPAIPTGQRICIAAGQPCPFGTPGADYGNAVAEVLADAAPLAHLYLAELGGGTDYLAVIDWMAANGVTSLVHYWNAPYDGPGDGTGFSAAIVDYAVSKGILWVNAAGDLGADPNYQWFAGPHWRGTWSDADNDRWLNFRGSDESLTAYCGALMGLRWSDWGASKTDYDLYISDVNATTGASGAKVLASANNQAQGANPLEGNDFRWLCNHDASRGPVYDKNGDNYVNLWVYRTTRTSQSPVGDVLEISVVNGWLEHANSTGTIAVPFADTKNPGAIVVGARAGTDPWWSSQGPTNDGRIRPDLSAQACIPTSRTPEFSCSGGFADTAGPAAVVAGIDGVVNEFVGAPTPAARSRHLIDLVAIRQYQPRDNRIGWGDASPGNPPELPIPAGLRLLPSPQRILETRANVGLIGTDTPGPVPADTTIGLTVPSGMFGPRGTVALLNVTLVSPTGLGWVQVFPTSSSYANAYSNLNAPAVGANVPNLVVTPLDWDSKVAIYVRGGGHLVVDLLGYFDNTWDSTGRWESVTPYLVADTAACVGVTACTGQPVPAGSSVDIPLAGTSAPGDATSGIPASGAYAAVVSVTATEPTARGYASALPGGSTGTPSTSTINYDVGRPHTGTAIIPLVQNGSMRLFSSTSGHYRVDVLGYFRTAPTIDDRRGMFHPLVPGRVLDTRQVSSTPPAAGSATVFDLTKLQVPGNADAAWLNLTSTLGTSGGRLQVAADASVPSGNHVNVSVGWAGQVAASAAPTAISGLSGVVRPTMATHIVVDAFGWFDSRPEPLAADDLTVVARHDGSEILLSGAQVSTDEQVVLIYQSVPTGPGSWDLRLTRWDRSTDALEWVDVGPQSNHFYPSGTALLSGNGQTVIMPSTDDTVVPGDVDGASDVYARDADGTFEVLSVDSAEQPTSAGVTAVSVSDDGTKVLLQVTGNSTWGPSTYYLRDRVAGTTTPVDSLVPLAGGATLVSMLLSPDGTHLVASTVTPMTPSTLPLLRTVQFIDLTTHSTVTVPHLYDFGNYGHPSTIDAVTTDGGTVLMGGWVVSRSGGHRYLGSEYRQMSASGTLFATYDDQRLKVVRADGTEVDVHRSVSGATPDGLLMPPPVLGRSGTSVYFYSSAKNLIAGTVDSNVNTHLYRLALS